MTNIKTAGIIIIGNEILSGRTQDTNSHFIAKTLNQIGVQVVEIRVIPDVIETIIACAKDFSARFDYVFSCGGIGPTHDDKTAEAMAKAFDSELFLNPDAYQILVNHYGDEKYMNDGRTKMAYLPRGATMIDNPVSAAPGFIIENVHVMAGVPKIMQAMLLGLLPTIEGGDQIHSRDMMVYHAESSISAILQSVEDAYDGIEIGSYPRYNTKGPEVTIIIRGFDKGTVDKAYDDLSSRINAMAT